MKILHVVMITAIVVIVMAMTAQGQGLTTATFYDFSSDQLLVGAMVSVINFNKVVSVDTGLLTEMNSIAYMVGLGLDLKELAAKLFTIVLLPKTVWW